MLSNSFGTFFFYNYDPNNHNKCVCCLLAFVVVYTRSTAEQAIMYDITGICLVLVTGYNYVSPEISFISHLKAFSGMRTAIHLLFNVIWKSQDAFLQ